MGAGLASLLFATTTLAGELPSGQPSAAACPVRPSYPLPTSEADLQALLARADAASERCLRDAPFHAWRGAILLLLQQPQAAGEALERALLLDPDLPGAQLDYAQALAAQGDLASARGLLRQLAARRDLPDALRPALQRELAAAEPQQWLTRWQLMSALGYDTNLTNAPFASELTLTFPQGPVTLPLQESVRPQEGAAWLNALQWQALRPQGAQLWLLQAELRARHTNHSDSRYQQADFGASWLQAPDAPQQWIVRAGASRVDFGGQQLLQEGRLHLLRQWQAPSHWGPAGLQCRVTGGGELELRRYPSSRELDGRYTGLVATLACDPIIPGSGIQGVHQGLTLRLKAGREHALSQGRPGGNYDRVELRAGWVARLGSWRLDADYTWSHQRDSSGYSPLLADNLARRAERHTLRMELARPLPQAQLGGPDWFLSVEGSKQASNLPVFASRQAALYTGLRWTR